MLYQKIRKDGHLMNENANQSLTDTKTQQNPGSRIHKVTKTEFTV